MARLKRLSEIESRTRYIINMVCKKNDLTDEDYQIIRALISLLEVIVNTSQRNRETIHRNDDHRMQK